MEKGMSVEQMRAVLRKAYHGAWKWVSKVNKMSDAQVYAIYMRMLESGQLSSKY